MRCNLISRNKEFLNNTNNIKLTCCTYHNSGDALKLKYLFDELGYYSEFSDGYMLYPNDFKEPYFRHGLIRAERITEIF